VYALVMCFERRADELEVGLKEIKEQRWLLDFLS
jgi:hypothetical protein